MKSPYASSFTKDEINEFWETHAGDNPDCDTCRWLLTLADHLPKDASLEHLSELARASLLAEQVLDRPYVDPDDDLAILARQLLRALARVPTVSPDPTALDAAWAEAEAACEASGYRLTNMMDHGTYGTYGQPRWHIVANQTPAHVLTAVAGEGPTFAAALHALAVALRETKP